MDADTRCRLDQHALRRLTREAGIEKYGDRPGGEFGKVGVEHVNGIAVDLRKIGFAVDRQQVAPLVLQTWHTVA